MAPRRTKNVVLLVGSLCFYIIGTIHNPEHFLLFIVTIIADFAIAIWIEKHWSYAYVYIDTAYLGYICH